MNNPTPLINVARRRTAEEEHAYESAGTFVQQTAIEIQNWLIEIRRNGGSKKKRWVLSASLSSGVTIKVRTLSARGHSMIKLEGELSDGAACLLVTNQHCVQLIACQIEEETEAQPKREIGFHTGMGDDIKIEQ